MSYEDERTEQLLNEGFADGMRQVQEELKRAYKVIREKDDQITRLQNDLRERSAKVHLLQNAYDAMKAKYEPPIQS